MAAAGFVAATPAVAVAGPARELIVGGNDAAAGAWPSLAYLTASYPADGGEDRFACTGTVVAPDWVLTAAHCTRGENGEQPDAMTATVGVADYTDPAADRIPVDELVPDADYDPDQIRNDIALVHLSRPTGQPAMALAGTDGTDTSPPGTPNAAGWGATDAQGTRFTPILQQAYLQIQSAGQCSAFAPDFDADTQTCAGTPGTAGACLGDSGGPLVEFDPTSGAPVLWGVTSYRSEGDGPTCSLASPTVYTWAPAFAAYITSTMANDAGAPSPDPTAPVSAAPARSPDPTAPGSATPAPGPRALRGLRVRSSITRAAARAGKLRVSFIVPPDARFVRVRLSRSRHTALALITAAARAGTRQTIALTGRRVKHLSAGRYTITVGAGPSRTDPLSRVARATIRVKRRPAQRHRAPATAHTLSRATIARPSSSSDRR